MVGVVGSSPIAPTKFGNLIKHLAETLGAFFWWGKSGANGVRRATWLLDQFTVGGLNAKAPHGAVVNLLHLC